jgi:SAM-dependent methyltransferase
MGLGLRIMPKIKRDAARLRRRLETRNFRCGKVALGERLDYGFPRGWIHIDWDKADHCVNLAEQPILPLEDGAAGLIFSAHLIEHLPQERLLVLLGECHRILKPGGRIRIECPDGEKLVDLFRRSDPHMLSHFRSFRREKIVEKLGYPDKYLEDHLSVLGELANYIVPGEWAHMPVYASREEFDARLNSLDLESFAEWCASLLTPEQRRSGGHQNILYFSKVRRMMEEAGFRDVVKLDFGRTTIPGLELNTGSRASIQEKPHRAFYSLYVEATRP